MQVHSLAEITRVPKSQRLSAPCACGGGQHRLNQVGAVVEFDLSFQIGQIPCEWLLHLIARRHHELIPLPVIAPFEFARTFQVWKELAV